MLSDSVRINPFAQGREHSVGAPDHSKAPHSSGFVDCLRSLRSRSGQSTRAYTLGNEVFCDVRFDKTPRTLCGPPIGQILPFAQFSELFGRAAKIGKVSSSSPFLRAAQDSRRTPRRRCEDLAYISIDVRIRNISKAIGHLRVWRHGVSEKGGSNSLAHFL